MKIYRLSEVKTNQLRKLYLSGNIDEDQFNSADKFFKEYPAFEKEIDWNRGLKITWDDLEKVIKKERNTKSQVKNKIRKGLEGFKEGKDYLILDKGSYNGESWVAYQPFTWEASRMIASHYVEPSNNEYGEVKDAGWCTAYQKDRKFWDDHNGIEAFIYICGRSIPTRKIAISISIRKYDADANEFLHSLNNLNFNIWDFTDYNDTVKEDKLLKAVPNLHDLIEKAYNNWENKYKENTLSKLKFNPKTNKYDYDGSLLSRGLKYFLAKDRDGFIINFGEVTGIFDCSRLGLTSLKGVPLSVEYFICNENKLTSLKGSPQIVKYNFECNSNQLTSLEGSPREVGGNFSCSDNQLTSLKGAPKTVGGSFDCRYNHLTSLNGAPQYVDRNFYYYKNPDLHSLDGIGKVRGEIVKDY